MSKCKIIIILKFCFFTSLQLNVIRINEEKNFLFCYFLSKVYWTLRRRQASQKRREGSQRMSLKIINIDERYIGNQEYVSFSSYRVISSKLWSSKCGSYGILVWRNNREDFMGWSRKGMDIEHEKQLKSILNVNFVKICKF